MSGAWRLSMVTGDLGSTQIHVLRDYVCLRCIKGYESTAKAKACVANRTWAAYSLVSLFPEVAQVRGLCGAVSEYFMLLRHCQSNQFVRRHPRRLLSARAG